MKFSAINAQSSPKLDSLIMVYEKNKAKNDTVTLNTLLTIIRNIPKGKADLAFEYAEKATQLSETLNIPFFNAKTHWVKAELYINHNKYDDAKDLLVKALPIFKRMKKYSEVGDVFELLGKIDFHKKENNLAKANYEEALKYFILSKDKKSELHVKGRLASIYGLMGQPKKAIEIHNENIQYFEKNNLKAEMAKALGAKSHSHYQMGEINESIYCLLQSLKINEQIGNLQTQLFNYQNLAVVYNEIGQLDKALEFAQKGLQLNEKVKNKRIETGLNNVICVIYSTQSNHKKAIECYQKIIDIYESENNIISAAENYGLMVAHLVEDKQYTLAFNTYQNLINIYEKSNTSLRLPHEYYRIGNLLLSMPDSSSQSIGISPQNKFIESLAYLNKGLKMAQEHNDKSTQKVIQMAISKNYEAQKNYEEAYSAFQKYIILKDSISGDEVQKRIARSEIQYEFDKKELTLKYEKQLAEEHLSHQILLTTQEKQKLLLNEQALTLTTQEKDLAHLAYLKEQAENEENAQLLLLSKEREKGKELELSLKGVELSNQKKQNLFLGIFTFLLLGGLGSLIYFYQILRKQKDIISQQNQLNEHTISILSHDIKEPLLGVKLLLNRLNINDPYLAQASLSLENQISSVNGVLNNLLKMKKVALMGKEINTKANVEVVVSNVVKELHHTIQSKNLTIENLVPSDFTLPIVPEKLQIICHNLLSNAIKYSHPHQSIKIYQEGNGFCIQDFGVGLSSEYSKSIMSEVKSSNPGTHNEKGMGMGLFLVGMMLKGEHIKVIFESPAIGGTIAKVLEGNI